MSRTQNLIYPGAKLPLPVALRSPIITKVMRFLSIFDRGHKHCWLWSAANTSQDLEVKCKPNRTSKLQQGHSCRRNRAEVKTIQEHDIKLHPILNEYLEQNTRGWSRLYIKYQVSEDTWKTPAESSRRHSDQGDRRTPVTISYPSVSFAQLHRPWGCSRQLAHASQRWGWSKTWDQTFVWVSKELSRAVILAYYFMICVNEELPCELGRTAPLCWRGQPRQP